MITDDFRSTSQEFMVTISTDRKKLNGLLGEIISKKNMDIAERQYKGNVESINNSISSVLNDYFAQLFLQKQLINYDYIVTYQNDEFQDMSQGKKSFVILKLLLEFSDDKKPVLIDQPEDSLDNRAIYHELRNYLLGTKKNRQIIVVTHNPNVVVGSDTENIIVAHQQSNLEKNKNNKKFQYINGSLEDTHSHDKSCEFILESQGIREHIFDVLEGGEEAFTKREQKYNYKKII
ncbi:MAG: AAA family ATPase [Sphaerochaeta sp.]